MSRHLSWPASLRPWRRWIIVALVLVLVRVTLPLLLRAVIASQASQALHARVEIGDVDLALYRASVVLKDVAVYAPTPAADAASTPTPAAAPDGQAASQHAPPEEPVIAWKRFAVAVRWLPLLQKTIVLREAEIDSPRVALDRLPDGQLNLMQLVSVSAPPPASSPTPAEPAPGQSGWGFGLDHFVLREGGLRFRDFKVKESEPIELKIPSVQVSDVTLKPGLYGEPTHLSVTVDVDQGSLQLEATLVLRSATERQLEAYLKVRSLPLCRARLYIPKVGWSAMEGGLDADITYNFDTATESAVRGTATVGDFSVRVANLDEPALGWKTLTVKIDPVDLRGQRAVVSALELNGATLLVRPQGGDLLPFLAATAADSAPAAAALAPAAEPSPAPAGTAAAATQAPWRWSVSSLRIADTRVRLFGTDAPLDVGVGLDLTDLADHADQPAHVALALTAGTGTLNADGGLRVAPPGFAGTVRMTDLSLPELAAAAGALPRDLLQAARLGADLTVEAGLATSKDGSALNPSDVRVHGKLSLADVKLTPPTPPGLSVGVRAIDLAFTELQVPGVLPAPQPDAAAGSASSVTALTAGDVHARCNLSVADMNVAAAGPQGYTFSLRSLDLGITDLLARGAIPVAHKEGAPESPSGDVQLGGRLTLGDLQLAGTDAKAFSIGAGSLDLPFKDIALPGVLGKAAGDATARPLRVALGDIRLAAPSVRITRAPEGFVLPNFSGAPAAAEPAPQPVPAAAPAVPPAPPRVAVAVDSLRLTDGNVVVDDRTVKPFYRGGLSALNMQVTKLRWPDLTIGDLRLTATGAEQGTLDVYGALTPDGGWLVVNGDKLALVPFNPYATTFSGYSIATGKVSVVSKVSFATGQYYASNYLTLHNLGVRGDTGESLFQRQFGIPLSMALALMRDTQGDIGLDIPVTVDQEGATVGLFTVVRGALQRAILGALASPLKLVGAVFSGDKVESVVPPAVAFLPGRAEPAPNGAQQLDQVAALLASRPGIGVTLDTSVTPTDVRWLREQALREEWAGQGIFAKLKDLPQRGAREKINHALEARAHDEEGTLDPDDAATLDHWLDERPAIPAERLQALAVARLARVEEVLCDQHGSGWRRPG